jgi:hypothetical protein
MTTLRSLAKVAAIALCADLFVWMFGVVVKGLAG